MKIHNLALLTDKPLLNHWPQAILPSQVSFKLILKLLNTVLAFFSILIMGSNWPLGFLNSLGQSLSLKLSLNFGLRLFFY